MNKELLNAVLINDINKVVDIATNITTNQTDKYGRTVLFDAVLKNNIEMVKLLCAYGSNINHKDKDGKTPLHFAVQENFFEITRTLIELGADVNAQDENGNTIICEAVFSSKGKGDIILLLKEKGANPYMENIHGVSAIELAKTIGNYDVAKFFK